MHKKKLLFDLTKQKQGLSEKIEAKYVVVIFEKIASSIKFLQIPKIYD